MILTQTTEYALRAMLHIAAHDPAPVRAAHAAESLEIPANYLSKTLSRLAQAGLLTSTRGMAGGFRLSRPASEISIRDVISPFAANEPRRCLLGLGPCGHNPECQVHQRWLGPALAIDEFLSTTTIADLVSTPSLASLPTAAGSIAPFLSN